VEPEAAEPAEDAPLGALLALPPEDALEEEPPLGGSTATPPFEGAEALLPVLGALPFEGRPFEVLEPPVEAWLEPEADPPLDEAVPEEAVPDEALPEDGVDVLEGGAVAGCAELWVVELCAGGLLVWVPCPTGKNEPPVIKVAMIPAITATRAIPISRSGQLRLSQSMVPF